MADSQQADEASAAPPPTEFRPPPLSFTDAEGREIAVRRATDPVDALAAMYDEYEPEERAQGLPPLRAPDRRDWIEDLLASGLNLVAWHGDRAVGHAALLPYDDTAELVIFVHPDYQQVGIGSRLIRALLAAGQADGIGHVWLSVQRDNHVAMNLYRSVGFETTNRDRLEHEMERSL
ncbi:MAG: N-acetyltransferase family protein [Haloarculaceae archaeon]